MHNFQRWRWRDHCARDPTASEAHGADAAIFVVRHDLRVHGRASQAGGGEVPDHRASLVPTSTIHARLLLLQPWGTAERFQSEFCFCCGGTNKTGDEKKQCPEAFCLWVCMLSVFFHSEWVSFAWLDWQYRPGCWNDGWINEWMLMGNSCT